MSPKLIRTELDEGATTWVVYGASADVSELQRDLTKKADEIIDHHLAHKQASPPAKKKKAPR